MSTGVIPDIYGPLVSRGDVEAAVIKTLRRWMVAYIAAVERWQGLPARAISVPPGSESYAGDLDYEAWEASGSPTIIVVAQPFDAPLRTGPGEYNQTFDIQVAAVVSVTGDGEATRVLADQYGIALAALLTQQGDLGHVAQSTMLVGSPRSEYLNPDVRDSMRAVVGIHSLVCAIVDESTGPRVPPSDPYARPGDMPPVEHTHVTVQAVSVTQDLPTASS
jgi:hypothetical protein